MISPDSATPWYRLALHTPLTTLAIFVAVSLVLRENYPFSHFPMYSSPKAPRAYYLVTNSEEQPLPISTLTGVTPPKIGKIHWRKSREQEVAARKLGKSHSGSDHQAGREICAMLREQAAVRGQNLPQGLRLFRVEIQYDRGVIKERKELLFAE